MDDVPEKWPHFGSAAQRSAVENVSAKEYIETEFRKTISTEWKSIALFTDGSSKETAVGGGGAAVICCDERGEIVNTISLPLGRAVSSFCAETSAIKFACEWARDKLGGDSPQNWVFRRDGCILGSGARHFTL